MLVAAVALVVFVFLGQDHHINFGRFPMPPIYGYYRPYIDPLALVCVPIGVVLAGLAWIATSTRRLPTWLVLGLIMAVGVAMAAGIALVRGRTGDLTRGVTNDNPKFVVYTADLHFIDERSQRC